ncbi:hypothetical protein M422DRAFT_35579 [Sphaerobolus stellatus SS14]|uniref:HD domain-containing protein n=1 Tax=Sphaerobolus stellatus (strain SS14) TaxID=990650 RepID=A0A0C9V775_SPHS4|nr:hypothetical protein M422DRAFT_35579 [Sphaerobolus stellatus SS14]
MSSQTSVAEEDADVFDSVREIKCPVHGYIPLTKIITSIIDTPQFQRLRYLKQLGTSYYVWPGAAHNRFEHSLGVYYLASLMVKRLQQAQPSLNITDRDVRCVEIAALCHDLGHGPFSHVWDNIFIPTALPGSSWKHEDASEDMLDYLVEDNQIDLQPDEVNFIKDLIAGSKRHSINNEPSEKEFLFEIVANKRNGIDVDKFDYIARDTRAIGRGTVTDLERLIKSARVINGQICYSEKNAYTVLSLFQERFNLHKTIYTHKTAKAIEFMIVDALIRADPYLQISGRINNPKRYTHLTDDILLEIERSECEELQPSRDIIRRVRTRDLYKLVDKTLLPWEKRRLWEEKFTAARIVEIAKNLDIPEFNEPDVQALVTELKPDHFIVDLSTLHHGMGDQFPLDNCMFYGKYNPNEAFPARKREDLSHSLPNSFGEFWNRIYARDPRFVGVIQKAARALHEELMSPSLSSNLSTTPEAVQTPLIKPQSSFSSVASGSGILAAPFELQATSSSAALLATPAPQSEDSVTGKGNIPATPSVHNNFMTVPPHYSPSMKRKNPAARKLKSSMNEVETVPVRTTRSRKRAEEGGGESTASDTSVSLTRKRKKTTA